MQGILELITLMLAMSGLGVDENSKAPSADAVLAYTVDDADVVAYLDVVAVGPRNHKVLVGLPDDPMVKASPWPSRPRAESVSRITQAAE